MRGKGRLSATNGDGRHVWTGRFEDRRKRINDERERRRFIWRRNTLNLTFFSLFISFLNSSQDFPTREHQAMFNNRNFAFKEKGTEGLPLRRKRKDQAFSRIHSSMHEGSLRRRRAERWMSRKKNWRRTSIPSTATQQGTFH